MENLLAITIGAIYAFSFYLLLRRSLVKVILGVLLFGQGVNLLIFTAAGLTPDRGAFLKEDGSLQPPYADPLPQALILTAIVIGFGVLAFTLAMMHRLHRETGTDDLDELRSDEFDDPDKPAP
ncbi:MAG: NADH-quinone oxidoreductase subunit K [Chthoniobacterales bacterium]|nr:NADH-quinone oxidoreductase subunit K [Chthoniobacterales bacterium]